MTGEWAESDVQRMRSALTQARLAADLGEIPVGAVVVAGGEVVGLGHNRSVADRDPSAHAEIIALRNAGKKTGNHRLVDAALYVTLEPCAMCAGALVQARVSRIVFGAYDPKAGALGSVLDLSSQRELNHRFEVNGGLLQEQCAELLQKFFARKRL